MIGKTNLNIDWGNHKVFESTESQDSEGDSLPETPLNHPTIPFLNTLHTSNQHLRGILSSFQFFQELQVNLQLQTYDELLRNLHYHFVQKFETIFQYGEVADKFYFILQGSCVALIPGKQHNQFSGNVLLNQILSLHPNFIHAKSLRKGKYFGELGLKHNVKRKATIVAAQDSHLLYCDAQTYKTILHQYFQDVSKQKTDFFLKTPLFFNMKVHDIGGILIEAKKRYYRYGERIYSEEDIPRRVYFLVSGQVQLKKRFGFQEVGLLNFCQNQLFGEIEFVEKRKRMGSAYVESSKAVVYSLRYQKFLDNLFSYKIVQSVENNARKQLNHLVMQVKLIERTMKGIEEEGAKRNEDLKKQSSSKQIKEEQTNYFEDPLKLFKKVVITKKILTPLEKEEIKKKSMGYLKNGRKKNINLELKKVIKGYKSMQVGSFGAGCQTERLQSDHSYDIKLPIISSKSSLLKKIGQSSNYPYMSEF